MEQVTKRIKEDKEIKKNKAAKTSKSVEVKVNIPVTHTSVTILILALLLSLVGFSGYLGVKSVWKFTHPQFNVSFDNFKALAYIAKGQVSPPQVLSTYFNENGPGDVAKKEFIDSVTTFKSEFRDQFKNSRLAQLADNEFFNLATSFCEAKQKSIDETGKFSAAEIIATHQSKYVLRYPGMNGLDAFVAGVGQRAFEHLCKDN